MANLGLSLVSDIFLERMAYIMKALLSEDHLRNLDIRHGLVAVDTHSHPGR